MDTLFANKPHEAECSHVHPEGLTNARAQNSTGSPEIASRQVRNLLAQTSTAITQHCKIKALGGGICFILLPETGFRFPFIRVCVCETDQLISNSKAKNYFS